MISSSLVFSPKHQLLLSLDGTGLIFDLMAFERSEKPISGLSNTTLSLLLPLISRKKSKS